MELRVLLVLCVCLFSLLSANAQNVILFQKHPDVHGKNLGLSFFYYTYESEALNLEHFKKMNPEISSDMPDKLIIIPPKLKAFKDTVYAVGYLRPDEKTKGLWVVFIIGNYESNEPVYYADLNFNRDFTDDGPPIHFSSKSSFKELNFNNPNQPGKVYKIRVSHPRYQEELELPEENTTTPTAKSASNNPRINMASESEPSRNAFIETMNAMEQNRRFQFKLMANFGFGLIKYSFKNKQTGYPTWYDVRNSTKGISGVFSTTIHNFRIGVLGGIMNTYYYSSYRRTRFAPPTIICTTLSNGSLDCQTLENITLETNPDIIPKNKVFYGLQLEYGITVGPRAQLAPYANIQVQSYLPDEYKPLFRFPDESFSLGTSVAYEAGIFFSYAVSPIGAIVVSGNVNIASFNPEGYFDLVSDGDLENSNITPQFGIGYQFRFY